MSSSTGSTATTQAWKKTAASRLLNETTTGAMYEAMLPRVFDAFLSKQSDVSINGKELTDLLRHLAKSGFAVGINRAGGTGAPRCFGLVIRGGAKGDVQKLADRVLRAGAGPRARRSRHPESPAAEPFISSAHSPAGTIAWWSEGDDLVVSLVARDGADAIIEALDGRAANAIAHPNRQALLQSEDIRGFEPVGLAFFDMAALPPCPRRPSAWASIASSDLIIAGAFRTTRWSRSWARSIPAPRTGIPAMFDQPTFDAAALAAASGRAGGIHGRFHRRSSGSRHSCVNRSAQSPGRRLSGDPGPDR